MNMLPWPERRLRRVTEPPRLSTQQRIKGAERRERRFKVLPLDQLRGLPRVTTKDNESGVYFLWEGPQLVYIGQSQNVSVRLGQHAYFRMRQFTHATFEKTHPHFLRFCEGKYIWHYGPPLNVMGRAWN